MNKKERAKEVLKRLKKEYKHGPEHFVQWSNPLELLIATVLSAQCTDKKVNEVTRVLFKKYKSAKAYANAPIGEIEKIIRPTGFYKSKAKYLKGIGEIITIEHKGQVPDTKENLLKLPGVAKKTASLVLAKGFGKIEGVAVDTHVKRVPPRLGLTKHTNPDKIATDLENIVEKKDWLNINEYLILHGRAICKPRKPKCNECSLKDICPSAGKIK